MLEQGRKKWCEAQRARCLFGVTFGHTIVALWQSTETFASIACSRSTVTQMALRRTIAFVTASLIRTFTLTATSACDSDPFSRAHTHTPLTLRHEQSANRRSCATSALTPTQSPPRTLRSLWTRFFASSGATILQQARLGDRHVTKQS
ncbi:hypothetical protein TRVL_06687 [Trypanosoma vivax]|nr:hypothetical protein TRVL_06687 [Trypanosoma vivax]